MCKDSKTITIYFRLITNIKNKNKRAYQLGFPSPVSLGNPYIFLFTKKINSLTSKGDVNLLRLYVIISFDMIPEHPGATDSYTEQ